MDWWLEHGKPKIARFFGWKSKEAYDEFNRAHQTLHDRLRRAYDDYYRNPAMLATINRLKGEMLALQRRFTQAFVRINQTIVAGAFQLGERRRTTISQLEGEGGNLIDDSQVIQDRVLQYFSEMYSEPVQPDFFSATRLFHITMRRTLHARRL